MTIKVAKRLPAVRSLYQILPKGTEGGKEFSRIVNLLLFHDARSNGRKVTIFSDASGDFQGLDSFGDSDPGHEGSIGYQYKFFPSPITDKHRSEIKRSLQKVVATQSGSRIKNWVLVTPEDLLETATRRTGGDVTWFENLRNEFSDKLEIEHWGHTKLQLLFLNNPVICLYYYPELIDNGFDHKDTIQSVRSKYNKGLLELYRGIEFVGMSVRDEEASRSVPMERIYIPLTVVPEVTSEEDSSLRLNPVTLLSPGRSSIILGDPGSGKSTLLRFLALLGMSKELQKRHRASPDDRLPIIVTLRRYADELKSRRNLPLIDYLLEIIKADFTINNIDRSFLEYYLETGQSIILFDGLDELPDSNYKKTVRDRIRTFASIYPGNSVIVTSRIVGYGDPFRFDEELFYHCKVGKLQLPEIEQFVRDWYFFRIENEQKRKLNIESLISTIRDEDHEAIMSLAENPLLLTIITLVHRVDAVLPDERVVLYEKCTETLLETWQNSKYGDMEVKNRGRVTRRNQRRMEVIAYWMQQKSVGIQRNERTVVSYKDLRTFLARYILKEENLCTTIHEAEDTADEFLDFVKRRAGLLIEAGDKKYSFVHLTFQEYLTAADITTNGEEKGVLGIWTMIKEKCSNSRWVEVIRLLIAGLKNDRSREILVQKILTEEQNSPNLLRAQLLGGLLIDGVEAAEDRKEEVIRHLFKWALNIENANDLRTILALIRKWSSRESTNRDTVYDVSNKIKLEASELFQTIPLALINVALNLQDRDEKLHVQGIHEGDFHVDIYNRLFQNYKTNLLSEEILLSLQLLLDAQKLLIFDSPFGNIVSTAANIIVIDLDPTITFKNIFQQQMFALCTGVEYGPFDHFNSNYIMLFLDAHSPLYISVRDNLLGRVNRKANSLQSQRSTNLSNTIDNIFYLDTTNHIEMGKNTSGLEIRNRGQELELVRKTTINNFNIAGRAIDSITSSRDLRTTSAKVINGSEVRISLVNQELVDARMNDLGLWQVFSNTPRLHEPLLQLACDTFNLNPRLFWWEALRNEMVHKDFSILDIFNEITIKKIESSFVDGTESELEIFIASCQIIFDTWLYMSNYYEEQSPSMFRDIIAITKDSIHKPIRLAHCVRDIAYGDNSKIDEFNQVISLDGGQKTAFGNYIVPRKATSRKQTTKPV